METARNREKKSVPATIKKIRELEEHLENTQNDLVHNEVSRLIATKEIEQELIDLRMQKHQENRKTVKVNSRVYNDTICRNWTQANKEVKP